VEAERVANEEQRVTQLQVLDDRRRRAQARVPDHGVPHHADLPARAPGSLAEVGLLAVGEVALVEEPDLVQARSAGDHQRAVGVAAGLPAGRAFGRAEDAAEVPLDDGLAPAGVLIDGPGQAETWPSLDGGTQPAQ